MDYPTPICESKETTDSNYDATMEYMMHNLDSMSIFAGTHNELSSYKLIEMMQAKGISKNDNRIWFGQLYGMSDNISYNLAEYGYNVAKYLPFGPDPIIIFRNPFCLHHCYQFIRTLFVMSSSKNRHAV